MKLIKDGLENKTQMITHFQCGSKFIVEQTDVKRSYRDYRTLGVLYEDLDVVICPGCGQETDIPSFKRLIKK